MAYYFSLDGVSSTDKGIRVLNVRRDILPPITSRIIDIPDRTGSYYYRHKKERRIIEIEIALISSAFSNNQVLVRTVSEFLDPATGLRDLILSDEADKVYKAVITEDTSTEQILKYKRGTIRFLIPNALAESSSSISETIKSVSGTFTRASLAYDDTTEVASGVPRYTNGLSLEQGTTNLIGATNFEDGSTDGWTGITATISSTVEKAKFKNRSLKVFWKPTGDYIYKNYTATFTAGNSYVYTGWIYAPSFMVGKTVNKQISLIGGINPTATTTTAITLVEGWQFFEMIITIDYSDRTDLQCALTSGTGVVLGDFIYFDAPQLEFRAYRTTFIDGTRVFERFAIPWASLIDFQVGSMEFILNKITTPEAFGGLFEIGAFTSPVSIDRFTIFNGTSFANADKRFTFQISTASTVQQNQVAVVMTNTPAPDTDYYLCIRWDLNNFLKIDVYDYTNTEQQSGSLTISQTPPVFGSHPNLYLGLLTSSNSSNWRFKAMKISKAILSDTDITDSINAQQLTPDYQTTYLNTFNNILSNVAFIREGTAPASPIFKVSFTASETEYKITYVNNGKYIRVVNSFVSGDILLIDGTDNKIYINGVLSMDKLDLNSEFFLLDSKEPVFTINQSANTETILTYTPKWV